MKYKLIILSNTFEKCPNCNKMTLQSYDQGVFCTSCGFEIGF
jgi:hypothetical protein